MLAFMTQARDVRDLQESVAVALNEQEEIPEVPYELETYYITDKEEPKSCVSDSECAPSHVCARQLRIE